MDDSEIIRLYQARDEQALAATAAKYGAYCASIARNILKNDEDADECVNAVYMKVWESIPPKNPPRFAAFIGKLTKNHALNLLKASSREKRGGGSVEAVYEELEEVLADGSGADTELIRNELLAAINKFLKKTPAKSRQAFVMRYWYCCDIEYIARRLGQTENNVSVLLHRTRQKLKEYLIKEGFAV